MSDDAAAFKITPMGDILFIVLKGLWTIQADLSYISELSLLTGKKKGRDWGICVDMTNWTMPQEVFESPFKSKISLKRRNQIGESWVTKSSTQGQELMPFFEDVSFTPQRFDDLNDALSYLENLGLKVPSSESVKKHTLMD
ncbi:MULTISPECIES: hypothetical protein [Aliiglaciecola]|uniref:hypothetical protein n=1 Tax=Aliiglaciecola TaxID=1406885 RepID=UPI001C08286D|nr:MULTISPECIES: hypothetical protein [Aliiglaciecola]MBU2876343.1 hypothetical protein [Aliiglaciecola lipolytica]MDO6710559.1 hypothetical protein [Aliiglaciecola sp. 2_MG-2023]MDO6751576.1 hypothetical protein [Aliiglaciecola sp. 1_MG-2023]